MSITAHKLCHQTCTKSNSSWRGICWMDIPHPHPLGG